MIFQRYIVPNFKLVIEYKGTNYAGWQKQKNAGTVQGKIEKVLKKIFDKRINPVRSKASNLSTKASAQAGIFYPVREKFSNGASGVNLIGSGRTDTGVHALGQVANFFAETELSKEKVREALNFYLPEDIRIRRISYADSRFHSRFSAKSKVYRYIIIQKNSPFLKNEAYFYPRKLDLFKMKEASGYFLGRHDFSSFQNRGSSRKDAFVNLQKIKINRIYLNPGSRRALIIELTANAFLYRMVRNLVALLLAVGQGKISPKAAKSILQTQDRRQSPPPVPAHGLYLIRVKY